MPKVNKKSLDGAAATYRNNAEVFPLAVTHAVGVNESGELVQAGSQGSPYNLQIRSSCFENPAYGVVE
jgi:hypothetical protein